MNRAPPVQEPPSLAQRVRHSPVTFALAAINGAVFVWAEHFGRTTEVPVLLRAGASEQLHVASGELWRLVTPMFLHVGLVHLIWNTYASIGWCTAVESAMGKARFLVVYLLSGFAGACASVIAHPVPSAGASGAMFGIIGATLVLRYRMLGSFAAFTKDRFVRANFLNMAIWTAIGLTVVNMDNFAHGGGLVMGATSTYVVTSRRSFMGWFALAASIVALTAAAARPGWIPRGPSAENAAAYAIVYSRGLRGFERNVPRAVRMTELLCRDPASTLCAEVAVALWQSGERDAVSAAEPLLRRACEAGGAVACEPGSAPAFEFEVEAPSGSDGKDAAP